MELAGCKTVIKEMQRKLSRHKEANLFLILALCFGIAMACINPPFQECDGWMHYLWATDVSFGNLARPVTSLSHEDGVVLVPENFNEFGYRIIKPGTGVYPISEISQAVFENCQAAINQCAVFPVLLSSGPWTVFRQIFWLQRIWRRGIFQAL